MKDYLNKTVKPKNKQKLIRGIREFWQNLTQSTIDLKIDHIENVLIKTVVLGGRASGY